MASAVRAHSDALSCAVVCGPSGCGKTSVGRHLSALLRAPFIDADDLHSAEAKDKMRGGVPLTDADRAPWLLRVAEACTAALASSAASGAGVVLACSALKHSYRDLLRQAISGRVRFLLLDVDVHVLRARLEARAASHFMPAALLDSQLATLERGDDLLCVRVAAEDDMDVAARRALEVLQHALAA